MYVIMKNGNVNSDFIFLDGEAIILFYSVISVIAPIVNIKTPQHTSPKAIESSAGTRILLKV